MSKNKIYLNIRGTEFYITTEDSEEYVRAIEDEVGGTIDTVLGTYPHFSFTMAAVLAALNYCDDSRKSSSAANNLRSQITKYIQDTEKLRQELDDSRREGERQKREIQTLKMRLAEADIPAAPEYRYRQPEHQPKRPSQPRPQKQSSGGSRSRQSGSAAVVQAVPPGKAPYYPEEYVVSEPQDLLTLFEEEARMGNE